MSYLEIQAKKYAKKNMNNFNEKINTFSRNSETYSEQECKMIYETYKKNCIFTKILQLSSLFENNYKEYKSIEKQLINIINRQEFTDLYTNNLGKIYKKLFNKTYNKISLIDKIEDMNEEIIQLKECINGRIQYHFNCRGYTRNYNENTHKYEILVSVYMYNRIKDIQKLLNTYIDKYMVFKEQLKMELEEKRRIAEEKRRIAEEKRRIAEEIVIEAENELEEFDNLTTTNSKTLSEPFEEINTTKRTRRYK